jgi:hypothetical protein
MRDEKQGLTAYPVLALEVSGEWHSRTRSPFEFEKTPAPAPGRQRTGFLNLSQMYSALLVSLLSCSAWARATLSSAGCSLPISEHLSEVSLALGHPCASL